MRESTLADTSDVGAKDKMLDACFLESFVGHRHHLIAQYERIDLGIEERESIDGFDVIADDHLRKIAFSKERFLTDTHHGIGLENIKKRLTLLYGQAYTLSIDETEGQYDVLLSIPSQPELKLQ